MTYRLTFDGGRSFLVDEDARIHILRGAIRRRTEVSTLFASRGRVADRERRWARPAVHAYAGMTSSGRETAS